MNQNLNFSLLSLNVNGLGATLKRNCVFNWLKLNYKNHFVFFTRNPYHTKCCPHVGKRVGFQNIFLTWFIK